MLGGAAVPVLSTSYGGANVMGGELVFDYTGTSDPLALVLSDLENSYSNGWASGQIYSTTAASNGWALGYVDNGTTITVMPALRGDANLDGRVDINDLTIVLTNYGKTGATWSEGDFNYHGTVDINDLTIVLANYNQTLGASGVGSSAAGVISAVPEPCAWPCWPRAWPVCWPAPGESGSNQVISAPLSLWESGCGGGRRKSRLAVPSFSPLPNENGAIFSHGMVKERFVVGRRVVARNHVRDALLAWFERAWLRATTLLLSSQPTLRRTLLLEFIREDDDP